MADTTVPAGKRRSLDVAVHHDTGADTELGDQFDVHGWDTTILGIINESRQTYLVGIAPGTTTVQASTKDGSVTGSFTVEVTEANPTPPPTADSLVFTFGAIQ